MTWDLFSSSFFLFKGGSDLQQILHFLHIFHQYVKCAITVCHACPFPKVCHFCLCFFLQVILEFAHYWLLLLNFQVISGQFQCWRCAQYLRINGRYSKLSMVCQESSRCKGIINKGEETVWNACCPLDVWPQHFWLVRTVGNMVAGLLTSATQIAIWHWAWMVFSHITATVKKN